MAREIITEKDIQRYNQSEAAVRLPDGSTYPLSRDGYFDRLFKYIPAEIVAGYTFVLGVVKQLTDTGQQMFWQWSLFALFSILTPLYLLKIQKVHKFQQHAISLISFVVWVFALGGPFALCRWYIPVYGSILLPVFTLVAAIFEAEK